MTAQQQPTQGHQTVIDTKFPLSWLIGCSCAIVFSMGGFAVQVNSMSSALAKMDSKMDDRDDRVNLMQQTILIAQGKADNMAASIQRNSQDILDLRRDLEEIKRKQPWVPK